MTRYRVVLIGVLCWTCADIQDEPPLRTPQPSPATTPAPPAPPDPARTAINAWLTAWSTAQAASVRETCEREVGCDARRYLPEARPETTFGWDGAQRIERIDDWARGPRYRVQANGRTTLIYLQGTSVVGVDFLAPDGSRRNICRDSACNPG
jgi:hypothetical protein